MADKVGTVLIVGDGIAGIQDIYLPIDHLKLLKMGEKHA